MADSHTPHYALHQLNVLVPQNRHISLSSRWRFSSGSSVQCIENVRTRELKIARYRAEILGLSTFSARTICRFLPTAVSLHPDMNDPQESSSLLSRSIRRYPSDLIAVVVVTGLGWMLLFSLGTDETLLHTAIGLLFVLFLPGYSFVSLLFPAAATEPEKEKSRFDSVSTLPPGGSIDWWERVALSFGLSIVISPIIGIGLGVSPWGYHFQPTMLTIGIFTIACAWLGSVRRRSLPVERRFRIPYRDWYSAARTHLMTPDSRLDGVLNVFFAGMLLVATISLCYAVTAPKSGDPYTRFSLMTENSSGDLIVGGYPQNLTRGESTPLVLDVGNFEQRTIRYSVVVRLQRVKDGHVLVQQKLTRFHRVVKPNETWRHEYRFSPSMTGTHLRLQYLLYRDGVPKEPRKRTRTARFTFG